MARIAVIYYSATGNVHALANAVAEGAESAGAEVRVRQVEEIASEHADLAEPALGTPPRRGPGPARRDARRSRVGRRRRVRDADALRQRLGAAQAVHGSGRATCGRPGKLADKLATSFTSSQTEHGGQESTLLALNNTFYHWGMVIVPLGYTVHEVYASGGNPYGTSYTSGTNLPGHAAGGHARRSRAPRARGSRASPR